jgi:hypothetical protein
VTLRPAPFATLREAPSGLHHRSFEMTRYSTEAIELAFAPIVRRGRTAQHLREPDQCRILVCLKQDMLPKVLFAEHARG